MEYTGKNATTKVPLYTVENFDQYLTQLHAAFASNKYAVAVLSGFRLDPVKQFQRKHSAICKQLNDLPTAKEVLQDPIAKCGKFIQELMSHLYLDAEEFAAKLQKLQETKEESEEDSETVNQLLTEEIVKEAESNVQDWVYGESFIFSILVQSLRERPALVYNKRGAGRAQLAAIKLYHEKGSGFTTVTLIQIWDRFTIIPKESIQDYYNRLEQLAMSMQQAKPTAIVRSEPEIRLKYFQGLERGNRFKNEVGEARRDEWTLTQTHNWLLRKEDLKSLQLLRRHGMSKVKTADVGVAETATVAAASQDGTQEICKNFFIYGKCKFGKSCKYIHPQWWVKAIQAAQSTQDNKQKTKQDDHKRKQKQKPCWFFKKGKCKRGDKCRFSHEKQADVANCHIEESQLITKTEQSDSDEEEDTDTAEVDTAEVCMIEMEYQPPTPPRKRSREHYEWDGNSTDKRNKTAMTDSEENEEAHLSEDQTSDQEHSDTDADDEQESSEEESADNYDNAFLNYALNQNLAQVVQPLIDEPDLLRRELYGLPTNNSPEHNQLSPSTNTIADVCEIWAQLTDSDAPNSTQQPATKTATEESSDQFTSDPTNPSDSTTTDSTDSHSSGSDESHNYSSTDSQSDTDNTLTHELISNNNTAPMSESNTDDETEEETLSQNTTVITDCIQTIQQSQLTLDNLNILLRQQNTNQPTMQQLVPTFSDSSDDDSLSTAEQMDNTHWSITEQDSTTWLHNGELTEWTTGDELQFLRDLSDDSTGSITGVAEVCSAEAAEDVFETETAAEKLERTKLELDRRNKSIQLLAGSLQAAKDNFQRAENGRQKDTAFAELTRQSEAMELAIASLAAAQDQHRKALKNLKATKKRRHKKRFQKLKSNTKPDNKKKKSKGHSRRKAKSLSPPAKAVRFTSEEQTLDHQPNRFAASSSAKMKANQRKSMRNDHRKYPYQTSSRKHSAHSSRSAFSSTDPRDFTKPFSLIKANSRKDILHGKQELAKKLWIEQRQREELDHYKALHFQHMMNIQQRLQLPRQTEAMYAAPARDTVAESSASVPPQATRETDSEDSEINTLIYDKSGKDKDRRPLLDSGATHHVTPYQQLLHNRQNTNISQVRGITGKTAVTLMGTIKAIPGDDIAEVIYMPKATRTVISVAQLMKQHGGMLKLTDTHAVHIGPDTGRTTIGPKTKLGWYRVVRLPTTLNNKHSLIYDNSISKGSSTSKRASIQSLSTTNQLKREQIVRLHRNLGHTSPNKMRLVLSVTPINGLVPKDVQLLTKCESCGLGKQNRKSHNSKAKRNPATFGEEIHTDNTAGMPVLTYDGKRYLNVVIDKFSNWIWVLPISKKSHSVDRLRYIIRQELGNVTKTVRTDQGGEYMGINMGKLMEETGSKQETSCTQNSPQNGTAEKAIQDIMKITRTALADSGFPLKYWGLAAKYAAFVKNRIPCSSNEDHSSPYYMRYGKHPDYKRLQPFGQWGTARYHKGKAPKKKLGKQAIIGRLVGYDDQNGTKGFRILDPKQNKIVTSDDVEFMDDGKTKTGQLPDVSLLQENEEVTVRGIEVKDKISEETTEEIEIDPKTEDSTLELDEESSTSDSEYIHPLENQQVQFEEKPEHIQQEVKLPPTEMVKMVNKMTQKKHTKTKQASISDLVKTKITNPKMKTPRKEKPTKDLTTKITYPKMKTPRKEKNTKAKAPSPQKQTKSNPTRRSKRLQTKTSGSYIPEKHRKILHETEQTYTKGGYKASVQLSESEIYVNMVTGDMREASTVYTPKTHQEAMNCEDKLNWTRAVKKEYESIKNNKVFTKMKKDKLPAEANIISGRWVFKVKTNKNGGISVFKARLVARGFQAIPGIDYNQTYAPVANATSIRTVLAIATSLGLYIRSADFDTAFLNAKLETPVYFQPPPGCNCTKDEVWKLNSALYGLPNAPMLWNSTLAQTMKRLGHTQSKNDPCIFSKITDEEYTLVCIIVDDLFICSNKDHFCTALIKSLGKKFKIKDLGTPEYIIGVHINYSREKHFLKLGQELYIKNITKRFGQQDSKPYSLPADPNTHLQKDMGSPPTKRPYRNLIGSLIYAVLTRPDIATVVSQLSRYLSCPQEAHWNAAIRTLRYLYHTRKQQLVYKPINKKGKELVMYTDSSWNNDKDTSRSRSGFIGLFNNCMITWKSKLQPIVTLSSTESEYVGLCDATKEAVWLKRFIEELKFDQQPVKVYIDNKSTIALANHQMVKPRTKHITLRYHWIREQVMKNIIQMEYVETTKNIADAMTKNLNKQKFKFFFAQILK